MMSWTQIAPSVTTAFLASIVEFVEALTIVLAVGVTRGWRSALAGTGAALVILLALATGFGSVFRSIPIRQLQLVIGVLLLLFGFRWLRKAILRSAGVIALHDEAKIYVQEVEELSSPSSLASAHAFDTIGVVTAFKAVLLEGIEVVFIVIATGAGAGSLWPAALGAVLAGVIVLSLGVVVYKPLTKIPENQLKYIVGILISAFGIFWLGEGLNYPWPGGDLSIVGFAALLFCVSLVGVKAAKLAPRKTSKAGV